MPAEIAGPQELLGQGRIDPDRCLAVAVEDLLGDPAEMLARGFEQVGPEALDGGALPAEDERALEQGALDGPLQVGRETIGAVELAGAVVLDLLVRVVAVLLAISRQR